MIPKFGKKKGGAPASQPPPGNNTSQSKPADDKMTAAKSGPPPKKGKKKSGGGGGGIFKLLMPLVLVLALAAGVYYVYTNFLSDGSGGGIPFLSSENAAPPSQPETDAGPPDQAPAQPQSEPAAQAQAPAESDKQAPPAAAKAGAPLPDAPADGASALQAQPAPAAQVDCAASPAFLKERGLAEDFQISTHEPGVRGLILIGASVENSDAPSRYQHQSWSRAGFLDAFVMARNGDVYFAPSPRTGLGVDAPTNQDHLYKLDTNSGELADFLTLPAAAPSTPEFPFGIVSLAYNCETNGLYVTAITGSTPESQVGRIYYIDLNTGEIAGQLENVDAYGATVRATANGSQLLFGSTRDNQIRALDLNADGNFQGEPRTVAALAESQRARNISISNGNEMVVQAVKFNYANADVPQGEQVRLTYDGANDTWNAAQ